MTHQILLTGSAGLVGTALSRELFSLGYVVRAFDLREADANAQGDVRDADAVRRAMTGCSGIIHLAAVSRVIWGERDPVACRSINVDGLHTVVGAALSASERPWIVFSSSREVYGQPVHLPADEDTPLAPVNIYGRTKVLGEQMIADARGHGLRAAIVRLSNVYGSLADHPDRVVPAFIRAAATDQPLRVDGPANTFDFTHVDDAARGLASVVDLLAAGEASPPPIHLLTGRPTSLADLADLAVSLSGSHSPIREAPPRSYDVAQFHGSPARARALLGWSPRISLRDGLAGMIAALRSGIGGAA